MDHRILIKKYDLGHIEEHSPGLIHIHPNGQKVFKKLRNYILSVHEELGYKEVSSPIILHKDLWVQSGHWDKYQDLMFVANNDYAIKPMSCPGQINIFKHKRRSYKELPMKLFEFGQVHRNEPSGALSGWMRLRGFNQDDSHVFCLKNQIEEVIQDFIKMSEEVYSDFGFKSWKYQLSLRPEKRAGSDELWDESESALRNSCLNLGIPVIEKPGDGAFYGPKLEVIVQDSLGRDWQCGVAQLDFILPERFSLVAQNSEDKQERVVLIHHAIAGSLERFLSIVLENFGQLPYWLLPIPVAICPISEKHMDYASEILKLLEQRNIRALLLSDASLSSRLKILDEKMIPFRWIVGGREANNKQVSQRLFHEKSEVIDLERALLMIEDKVVSFCK